MIFSFPLTHITYFFQLWYCEEVVFYSYSATYFQKITIKRATKLVYINWLDKSTRIKNLKMFLIQYPLIRYKTFKRIGFFPTTSFLFKNLSSRFQESNIANQFFGRDWRKFSHRATICQLDCPISIKSQHESCWTIVIRENDMKHRRNWFDMFHRTDFEF